MERAERFATDEARDGLCLVLLGARWTGKTSAAIAALRKLGGGAFVYMPTACRLILSYPGFRDESKRAEKRCGIGS